MHVVIAQLGNVKIDDVRDVTHIDSPANHIGGDEIVNLAFAEGLHHSIPSRLTHVSMNRSQPRQQVGFQ